MASGLLGVQLIDFGDQIDSILFKVPKRYFAKDLSIFGGVLALSQDDPGADEGSDDNPIDLKNISTKDFESLLEVMFPV
jgi:hypothetical protein